MGNNRKTYDDEKLIAWFTDNLTSDEKVGLEEQLNDDPGLREKFEAYRQIWDGSSQLKTQKGTSADSRLENLHNKLNKSEKSSQFHIYPFWRYAAVFVMLLLAGSIIWYQFFASDIKHFETAYGEIKTIQLPDQSSVILNAGSSIEYDAANWEGERNFMLSGEAYFEVVSNGTPFIVDAGYAQIKVLGTKFNVKTDQDKTEVACVSGKVGVERKTESSENVILEKGLGAVVNKQGPISKQAFVEHKVTGWMSGKLYFENTPLKEVFKEFERYFGKKINVPDDIKPVEFTGKFDRPDLPEALKTVCLSAGLEFEIKKDSTVVVREN